MKPFKSVTYLLLICVMFSCVSKKELVYFQDGSHQKEYRLAPPKVVLRAGDVLNVSISTLPTSQLNTYSNATLQNNQEPIINGYTISEEGTITLPAIGSVALAGLTIDEARTKLTALVGEYFRDASVKVHLLTFMVTVAGEVSRPGRYTVYTQQLNLMDALALGGDLLPTADRKHVVLIRHVNDVSTRYEIDLTQDQVMTMPYYYLQPDDVIYVEPERYRTFNPVQPWSLALSGLSLIAVFINIFLQ